MNRTTQLAHFAEVVLEILETDPEWNADTIDRLGAEAIARGLADTTGRDPDGCMNGMFRRTTIPIADLGLRIAD